MITRVPIVFVSSSFLLVLLHSLIDLQSIPLHFSPSIILNGTQSLFVKGWEREGERGVEIFGYTCLYREHTNNGFWFETTKDLREKNPKVWISFGFWSSFIAWTISDFFFASCFVIVDLFSDEIKSNKNLNCIFINSEALRLRAVKLSAENYYVMMTNT